MRVVTYNIWNGGEDRVAAIEEVLRPQEADFVAVQEASNRANVELLARRLGMELAYGEANSEYAVAWLSLGPIARVENHRLPILDQTLLEIEVEGLRLFATHLSAGRTKADEPHRIDETQAILAELGGADLLVGDFNAVGPGEEIGSPPPDERLDHVSRRPIELILEAGYVDGYRALHDDNGWTYLSWHPWARLDHVFVGPTLSVERCEVVTDAGGASDHFPVVADVT